MIYEGRRATILGLGREGTALARFLARQGAEVIVTDIKEQGELKEAMEDLAGLPIRYLLGGHPEEALETDVVFVSPGVPREIPFLAAARRRGIELSSETRLFFALCPAPIIGITGSSGKTTTTSLVGEIMRAHGRQTYVGGNIGSPLLGLIDQIEPEDCVVMELSSFQLEALDQSPHVAAVLNLSPNHLDRHQTMDDYIAAKANILNHQRTGDWAILNADQETTRGLAELSRGQLAFFSHSQPVEQGAYLRGDEIIVSWQDQRHPVCRVSEIRLLGSHNLDNVLAACAVSAAAGAQAQEMGTVVAAFRGVEHRLELAGEVDGVQYFDDSIATSPDRTIAALECFAQPVVLLAGGREKHLPLEALARTIAENVKALVLFGEAAPVLEQAVRHASADTARRELPVYLSSDLRDAVHGAARMAERGDVVLLSPAFTSFDMYRDFAERGDHFKSLVREMMPGPGQLAGHGR